MSNFIDGLNPGNKIIVIKPFYFDRFNGVSNFKDEGMPYTYFEAKSIFLLETITKRHLQPLPSRSWFRKKPIITDIILNLSFGNLKLDINYSDIKDYIKPLREYNLEKLCQ